MSPARLKERLFFLTMLLVPILFFGLVEAGLRVAGYGGSYPLFRAVPGFPDYLQPSEDVANRYFASTRGIPGIPFDSFLASKDSSTFRIVVQGGSTAAGFPFYFSGSFPDMLEQRLLQSFPGRNVEVINTAMAAVNSYTLADFVDEIIAEEPDLVIIYAGHNEYYGALGVGSSESLGRSPLVVRTYLRLQKLRLVQALRSLLASGAAAVSGTEKGERPESTLMERMVGEQRIPYASPLYHDGLRQFKYNLSDILSRYRAAGIPVMIGTVASNERDQAPFISGLSDETDRDQWEALTAEVRSLLAGDDPSAALASLERMMDLDSLAASPFFLAARLYDRQGQYKAARRDYVRAKDRDELRFRAPEAINTIIRDEARRLGAILVESAESLANASPSGIPGRNVMTEHLHPNVIGYFHLADAFYDALRNTNLMDDWTRVVPDDVARTEILVTPIDSIAGAYRVQSLMASWPFRPVGSEPLPLDTIAAGTEEGRLGLLLYERELSHIDALDELQKHYSRTGEYRGALRAQLSIIQRYPFLSNPYLAAANVLLAQGRLEEAIVYCEASLDRAESAEGLRMLGSLFLRVGRNEEAIPRLERSIELEPSNLQSLYNLAGAYALTGNYEKSRTTGRRILERWPEHTDTRRLLSSLPPADRPGS